MVYQLVTYVPIIGILTFIVLVILFVVYIEKKRTKALQDLSRTQGFSFSPIPTPDLNLPEQFEVFHTGHSQKAYNIMKGRHAGNDWTIMDYKYTTGYGKHSHTYSQTVFLAKTETVPLKFHMAPENILNKLAALVGYEDVDFPDYPEFSKFYYLKSPDQNIRTIFTPEVLRYFEQNKTNFTIEAGGDYIAFYILSKRKKPEEIMPTLVEIERLLQLFLKR